MTQRFLASPYLARIQRKTKENREDTLCNVLNVINKMIKKKHMMPCVNFSTDANV